MVLTLCDRDVNVEKCKETDKDKEGQNICDVRGSRATKSEDEVKERVSSDGLLCLDALPSWLMSSIIINNLNCYPEQNFFLGYT